MNIHCSKFTLKFKVHRDECQVLSGVQELQQGDHQEPDQQTKTPSDTLP